jgi:hypothetical protein
MHFLFSVYYELTASTCFEHYLLIIRKHCIDKNWYILCVLCRLSVTKVAAVVYVVPPDDEQIVLETCRGC